MKIRTLVIVGLFIFTLASCSKSEKGGITDDERTRQEIEKNVALVMRLNSIEEQESDKITKDTTSEMVSKIILTKEQAIIDDQTTRNAIDQLRLFGVNKDNRKRFFDYVLDSNLKSSTKLAFLLVVFDAPLKDKEYSAKFVDIVKKEDLDPIIRAKVVSLFFGNNMKAEIPTLVDLYSLKDSLINYQITSTIASFGSVALTPINDKMVQILGLNRNIVEDNDALKRLVDLIFVTYRQNGLKDISYSNSWEKTLYQRFPLPQESVCKLQRITLDIVLNFARPDSYKSIERAINENICPENERDLRYAKEILDVL